jgi:transposase
MGPRRHELSDEEWARLEPLLPPRRGRGRPNHDHRRLLNGRLWILHTGAPWRDLPERYGSWCTVYSRFRRWSRAGIFDRVLRALQRDVDGQGLLDWVLWAIDGTNVRAHKAAAGGGKNRPRRRAG